MQLNFVSESLTTRSKEETDLFKLLIHFGNCHDNHFDKVISNNINEKNQRLNIFYNVIQY